MNIEEIKKLLDEPNRTVKDNLVIFAYILDEMYTLYEKKNNNYGDSFGETWAKLGPISGVTRLYDKLNRVANLVTGGKNDFESIEDTFIDLANYSVMCLVELQKAKLADIKADTEARNRYVQQYFDAQRAAEEKPAKKSKKTGKTILNESKEVK